MDIFDVIIWIVEQVRKSRTNTVAENAARRAQFTQTMSQLVPRAAATIVTPPKIAPVPIVVTPTGYTRAAPPPAAGAVVPLPQAAPSAEGLLVSGLFTQPRTLVAAFVASEILGPPVAFRGR